MRLTQLEEHSASDRTAIATVLDPGSGLSIGAPLELAIPEAFYAQLRQELGPGAGGDGKAPEWMLAGTLEARPRVNAERDRPSVFTHPGFIGPYVEFYFDLNWESITVVPETRAATPSP